MIGEGEDLPRIHRCESRGRGEEETASVEIIWNLWVCSDDFGEMLLPSLLLSGLIASAHGAFDCRNLELDGRKYDMSALKRVSWSTEKPTPPTIKKVFYDFDLCQPLPAPSPPNNPDFCPTGTRLCRTVSTARQGLEDRIVSVIPIAGDIGQSDFGVTLEKAPEPEAIVLRIRGGMYESVAQLARIVMVCDVNAREVSRSSSLFPLFESKVDNLVIRRLRPHSSRTNPRLDSSPSSGSLLPRVLSPPMERRLRRRTMEESPTRRRMAVILAGAVVAGWDSLAGFSRCQSRRLSSPGLATDRSTTTT